jgi:hypothetical protein
MSICHQHRNVDDQYRNVDDQCRNVGDQYRNVDDQHRNVGDDKLVIQNCDVYDVRLRNIYSSSVLS